MSNGGEKIKEYLDFAVHFLSNTSKIFMNANVEVKQKILGSILSENLVIEKNKSRTPKFTVGIKLLSKYGKDFEGKQKKTGEDFSINSRNVLKTELITNQIYLGFKELYRLKPILEEAGLYPITNQNLQVSL